MSNPGHLRELKEKLLEYLNKEKENLKLEENVMNLKILRDKIRAEKIIKLRIKILLKKILYKTSDLKLFNNGKKTIASLIRYFIHKIIIDEKRLKKFYEEKKKEQKEDTAIINKNNPFNNVMNFPYQNPNKNPMTMSGTIKEENDLEEFKSTEIRQKEANKSYIY